MQRAEAMGDDVSAHKDLRKGERVGWGVCRTGQGGLASDTFIIDQLRGNKHAH